MSISSWREQPAEQARLFNPAFLGALIFSAAHGYEAASDEDRGLPYALAFLALPIVLHKSTRDALPKNIRTSLAAWISVNALAQVGFPARAAALVPLVKDSIAVACNGGLLELDGTQLRARGTSASTTRFARTVKSPEVIDCLKKSNFVGKWFAGSGDYLTILALWGVRP